MLLRIVTSASVLVYAAIFTSLFIGARHAWLGREIAKKGMSFKNSQSELDYKEQIEIMLWAIDNGYVDAAAEWLALYTLLVCVIFAFAYMLLDGASWYLLLMPLSVISIVAFIVSLIRWGISSCGVRLATVNLIAVAILGGLLLWRNALGSISLDDSGYWYRWLWTPAGAFGGTMIICWMVMQPWQLFKIKGLHGFALCASYALFLTAGLGAVWFKYGAFPKHYLVLGYGLLGLWIILSKLRPKVDWSSVCAGVFLLVCTATSYWASENPEYFKSLRPLMAGGGEVAPMYPSFWPSANRRNSAGVLETEDGKPIRVLAAGPDISLFRTKDMRFPADAVMVMEPWHRYFAFDKTTNAILIGFSSNSSSGQQAWVHENECYVTTVDLGLTFKAPCEVFESPELARLHSKPIERQYRWRPSQDSKQGEKQLHFPDVLPVVQMTDGAYRFVRPDGAEWGFPLCWVRSDGGNVQVVELKD